MTWWRLSISWKMFTIISAVTALVVLFVAAMVAFNMRTGFAHDLASLELCGFP